MSLSFHVRNKPPKGPSHTAFKPSDRFNSMNQPYWLRIIKYSIKIIKNTTLQNLLAYTKPYASQPAPAQMPIFGSWTYLSVQMRCEIKSNAFEIGLQPIICTNYLHYFWSLHPIVSIYKYIKYTSLYIIYITVLLYYSLFIVKNESSFINEITHNNLKHVKFMVALILARLIITFWNCNYHDLFYLQATSKSGK